MGKWIKQTRKQASNTEMVPLVTIRPNNTIAFNSFFVAAAHLEEKPHVSVFTDEDDFRLGFQFHSEQGPDTYTLTHDGGGKKGGGRCFGVVSIMRKHAWLRAVASLKNPRLRGFEPKWNGIDSMWTVSLCPSYEHHVSDRSEIPSGFCGVYRYKRGDEIVYIGRGQIRSRFGSPEREDWDFETVEYSVVLNPAQQEFWETWWLDRFVEEQGKLPIYNRISGKRPKEAQPGR